jgi:ABC-2 type transport system ATP-binding protein
MRYAIDVKSLVKVYEGKVRALDGIDLKIKSGEVFALLGPNGAGKTTLMRILTTQIGGFSGKANVFGLDVVHEGPRIRELIGYIPQEMSVWTDVTGYENLLIYSKIYAIPKDERDELIKDMLKAMNLDDVANTLASKYSGGMIRRLEIACAMLIKPKLLFLDEPTIGLDPSARKAVWDALTTFKKWYGTTIFFNTHYMDEADHYSDRIAIINHGKVIKIGTPKALKRSLGGDTLIFEMEGKSIDNGVLRDIGRLRQVRVIFSSDSELRIIAKDADKVLPGLMDFLRGRNIAVNKVSMTKPTIDDVFLKYASIKFESVSGIGEIRQMRSRIARG